MNTDQPPGKTTCGKCGQYRVTPWRDNEYGYVCLPCLGEAFGSVNQLETDRDQLRVRVSDLEAENARLRLAAIEDAKDHDRRVTECERWADRVAELTLELRDMERAKTAYEVGCKVAEQQKAEMERERDELLSKLAQVGVERASN